MIFLVCIGELKSLTKLNIEHNEITSSGFPATLALCQLKELSMSENEIEPMPIDKMVAWGTTKLAKTRSYAR